MIDVNNTHAQSVDWEEGEGTTTRRHAEKVEEGGSFFGNSHYYLNWYLKFECRTERRDNDDDDRP